MYDITEYFLVAGAGFAQASKLKMINQIGIKFLLLEVSYKTKP